MPSHWLLLFCVVHRLSPDAPANLFCAINKISSSRFSQCSKSQFIEEPFRWIWNFRRLCEFRCTFCQRSIGKIYSSVRGTIMINWTLDGDRVLNRNRLCADRICYFRNFSIHVIDILLHVWYNNLMLFQYVSWYRDGVPDPSQTAHVLPISPASPSLGGSPATPGLLPGAQLWAGESAVGRLLCREGIPFCWKLKMHGVKL